MTVQLQAVPAENTAAHPLADIRQLVQNDLPQLPVLEPPGALRDVAGLWRWLASSQHAARPSIRRPRAAIFLSRHGAFAEQQDGLPQLLSTLKEGRHMITALASEANADLQVYELDIDRATHDFRNGKAMEAEEAAHAISYGMMTVQPGVDLLLVCAPNPAAGLAATEIHRALKAGMDPLDTLMRFGGYDIAAILGAVVAARLARVPVILEDAGAEAAGEILTALEEEAALHTRTSSSLLWERTDLAAPCRGVMLIPFLKSLASVS